MTRDEALEELETVQQQGYISHIEIQSLRTYILNSIPTPKVEVELERGYDKDVSVNGVEILSWSTCRQVADNLRTALGIEVKL